MLRKLTETCGFGGTDLKRVSSITAAVEAARCVDAGVTGHVEQSTLINVYNDQSAFPCSPGSRSALVTAVSFVHR